MKTTLYVDWENKKILSEEEHLKWFEQIRDEMFSDNLRFNDWLSEQWSCIDIFQWTPEEKASIRKDFFAYVTESAESWDEDAFSEHCIDI